jgi:hypothetical protein
MLQAQQAHMEGTDGNSVRNAQALVRVAYPMMDKLLHVKVPIGIPNTQGIMPKYHLEGLFDTGGCSSMGYEPYFLEIQRQCPQLVKEIVVLDKIKHKKINIGGVGGLIQIERIMYLYMPYTWSGEWAMIAVGLSQKLPITMIIGLPFIMNTKSIMDYDNECVYARVFQAKWKVALKTPFRKPPSAVKAIMEQSPGTMRVFHSSPSNTIISDTMDVDEAETSSSDGSVSSQE